MIAGAAAGLVAASTIPLDEPGIGWLVAGLAITAGVAVIARTEPASRSVGLRRAGWTALALGLLAVGTFRAAGWLFVLCVIGACVAGSLAVFGGRSFGRVLLGAIAVPVTAVRDLPWLGRGALALRGRTGGRRARLLVSVLVGLLLVVVFGALFAGADATFAGLVSRAVPSVQGGSTVQWLFLFACAAPCTAAAGHLLLSPPASAPRDAGRPLTRLEWAVPVGFLVALFAVFVADQVAELFGGADYVARTAGLTYAQYARGGFWQLLAVTALTMVVIAVVAHKADRADRIWLRVLPGTLAVLTLVIVASALVRMWSYQQAYGFTVLRLVVEVGELWLGACYLLVIAAGVRLRLGWVPRAVVATALATLLALAIANPEALVAHQDVLRWQQDGRLDTYYLGRLSPDAVAGLTGLPDQQRACVLAVMAEPPSRDVHGWRGWNASRAGAAAELTDVVLPAGC